MFAAEELGKQIQGWLDAVPTPPEPYVGQGLPDWTEGDHNVQYSGPIQAIVAPCGPRLHAHPSLLIGASLLGFFAKQCRCTSSLQDLH